MSEKLIVRIFPYTSFRMEFRGMGCRADFGRRFIHYGRGPERYAVSGERNIRHRTQEDGGHYTRYQKEWNGDIQSQGVRRILRQYVASAAPRPLEKNIAELEYLASASVEEYTPSIGWGKGIIGSADLIFPPENMVRFWGSRSEILPLPHYPLADGGLIEKEIGNR